MKMTPLWACVVVLAATSAPAAEVSIENAVLPARYAAPLPTSAAALRAWFENRAPAVAPFPHVVQSILFGDPRWLARLNTSAAAVPPAGALAWAHEWDVLFASETVGSGFCTRVRPIMMAPATTLRAVVAGPFARSCAKAADAALILRADTPSWAVVHFYEPWHEDGTRKRRTYDPRLAAAARDVILTGREHEVRNAASILIMQRDPRAPAALLAIHSEMKNRALADDVAMLFFSSDNAEGRRRAKAVCQRGREDLRCREEPMPLTDEPEVPDPPVSAAAFKARVEQLRKIGFDKVGTLDAAAVGSDAPELLLMAAGHAYWFDVETDQYPNQHDSLMRSLAQLVTPVLDDAIFEERAPKDETEETAPYELIAYSAGKRFRTPAKNLGDWYDVDAVLRLMNAVMADRKAPARFTNLATTDQSLIVVAAPPEVMTRAVRAGVLKVGEQAAPER